MIVIHGIESFQRVPLPGPRVRPYMEEDFLSMYPPKKDCKTSDTAEDGLFVISGVVDGLNEDE